MRKYYKKFKILWVTMLVFCMIFYGCSADSLRKNNDYLSDFIIRAQDKFDQTLASLPVQSLFVENAQELTAALRKASDDVRTVITLQPGEYIFNQATNEPLRIRSNTELRGNEATIKAEGFRSFLKMEGTVLRTVDMENDVWIEPLSSFPFLIDVPSASFFEEEDIILIQQGTRIEYNKVISVDIKQNKVELLHRTHGKYKGGKTSISIVAPVQNVHISNLTIEYGKKLPLGEKSGGVLYGENLLDVTIQNVNIKSLNAAVSSIYLKNAENVQIIDCSIRYGGNGITLDSTVNRCTVSRSIIVDTIGGIVLSSSENSIVDNTILHSGAFAMQGDGITIYGDVYDCIIRGNTIEGGNCYGIWGSQGTVNNTLFSENKIIGSVTLGINIESGENLVFIGNLVDSCAAGISIGNVDSVVIQNNILTKNEGYGLLLVDTPAGAIIQNNIIKQNGNHFSSPNFAFGDIALYQQDDHIIENNHTDTEIYYWINGNV